MSVFCTDSGIQKEIFFLKKIQKKYFFYQKIKWTQQFLMTIGDILSLFFFDSAGRNKILQIFFVGGINFEIISQKRTKYFFFWHFNHKALFLLVICINIGDTYIHTDSKHTTPTDQQNFGNIFENFTFFNRYHIFSCCQNFPDPKLGGFHQNFRFGWEIEKRILVQNLDKIR